MLSDESTVMLRAAVSELRPGMVENMDEIERDVKSGLSWLERQVRAEAAGRYTLADRAMVNDWACCAVGEKRRAMPEIVAYRMTAPRIGPDDDALYNYGMEFARVVAWDDDPKLGARYLAMIEDRVLRLKREHGDPALRENSG